MRTIVSSFMTRLRQHRISQRLILLVEVELNDDLVVRLAKSMSDVEFPTSSGKIYQHYPIFTQGTTFDNAGNLNSMVLSIANVHKEIQQFIDLDNGMAGRRVNLRWVFDDLLAEESYALRMSFTIQGANTDQLFAAFSLGHENLIRARFPVNRVMDDSCTNVYGDDRCKFTPNSTFPSCILTLGACMERDNAPNFRAFPSGPRAKS